MRRLCAIFLLALSVLPLPAQYRQGYEELYDSDCVRELKADVSYLSSALLEGRRAGSEGEALAAEYVWKALEDAGVEMITPRGGEVFGIAGADTLTSHNVVGVVEGWDAQLKDRFIVVGARLDNLGMDTVRVDGVPMPRIYNGAAGNASGVAMLLALGRKLATSRLQIRRSIVLVAFGASQERFAGSWYFLNRSFPAAQIDAMIELEAPAFKQLYAYTASNADMNAVVHALKGELLPVQAQILTEEPYPGDHVVFYDKEIPSVVLTSGRYPEHGTARDTYSIVDFEAMERSLEYVFSYTLRLSDGPKPSFRPVPKAETPGTVVAWGDCDLKPSFLSSADPAVFLEKWVYQYLRYPSYAVENGIQGRVIVDFIINEKGEVEDVKVSRSVHVSLDEEAVRVIAASPKWRPGRHRGKKVKVLVSLPVEFRLDKRSGGSFGINGYKIK